MNQGRERSLDRLLAAIEDIAASLNAINEELVNLTAEPKKTTRTGIWGGKNE